MAKLGKKSTPIVTSDGREWHPVPPPGRSGGSDAAGMDRPSTCTAVNLFDSPDHNARRCVLVVGHVGPHYTTFNLNGPDGNLVSAPIYWEHDFGRRTPDPDMATDEAGWRPFDPNTGETREVLQKFSEGGFLGARRNDPDSVIVTLDRKEDEQDRADAEHLATATPPVDPEAPVDDPINPNHYKVNGIETIDLVETLGFLKGNAAKYLIRAGKKPHTPELTDLQKCRWYIDRAIKKLEAGESLT